MHPPMQNRAISIQENRHHLWHPLRWPHRPCLFNHLLAMSPEGSLLLRPCPSSRCLPPHPLPSGLPITAAALPQFRTISSRLVTPHRSHSTSLPSPRHILPTHLHPITTRPPLHLTQAITMPSQLLLKTLKDPPALSGLIRMHPRNITPTSRLRATSARAQVPRTPGSTIPHRTPATTRWGLAQAQVMPRPDLILRALTIEPPLVL